MNSRALGGWLPLSTGARNALGAIAVYAAGLFVTVYSWMPLLDAEWSIIDDHEVMWMIGTRDRLPLTALPGKLLATEVGRSDSTRFRPSYYGARLLEAATWGKHPGAWYAMRFAVALVLAATLCSVCLAVAGPLPSLGFIPFALTRPYWADIFARLGPSETYAVLGVCAVVIGVRRGLVRGFGAIACTLVCAGTILAAGSKENFTLLALVPTLILVVHFARLSVRLRVLLFCALVYVAWIVTHVVLALHAAGHDVYQQDVSPGGRMGLLLPFIQRPEVIAWLGGTLLLLLVAALMPARGPTSTAEPALQERTVRSATAVFGLLTLYATQFVFYFGRWPDGAVPRYLFPGMLAAQLALFLGAAALMRVVGGRLPSALLARALPFFLAIGYLTVASADSSVNRAASLRQVDDTRSFSGKMRAVTEYLRSHPESTLVLGSHSPWDHEPIFSIDRYVRAAGITNPIAVKLAAYGAGSFDASAAPLEHDLARQLEVLEQTGVTDISPDFVPFSRAGTGKACFSLGLSGPPVESCAVGMRIWQ